MAIIEAGDREKVCVVSTYTPPRHKADEERGGKKKGRGLASKPRVGKALHRHRKVSYYSTATLRRLCEGSCLAALSCFGFACEPNVEGFAIFDLACREPLVSLGAFALPSYAILYLLRAFAFINNFVNEEFLLTIADDWCWRVEGPVWEKSIVVFQERLHFGCIKDWESVWSVREV